MLHQRPQLQECFLLSLEQYTSGPRLPGERRYGGVTVSSPSISHRLDVLLLVL